ILAEMRSRTLLFVTVLHNGLLALLTIVAASRGMGVYSFVVPVPIVSAIMVIVNWQLTRPPVRLSPQFSRWKYLLGQSLPLSIVQLLIVVVAQADYITLGLARVAEASIGAYVFAFSVAFQPLRFLAS